MAYFEPSWYTYRSTFIDHRVEFTPRTTHSTSPVPGIVIHRAGANGLWLALDDAEPFINSLRAAVAESRLRGDAGETWMGRAPLPAQGEAA